ncbi:metallophosphoesterase family protein [Parabacteroides sp. BX2]|jgi:Icc-related predicted phosphoesterase|uniref:Metallophosphoesterase family protein n=1 Tax=Parabacteroides segnis TaxID=2763058 RepID=A0ABR7E9J4_9BACT|nr:MULTISPECIES: metallophosphoesterase family protein [Parabacteroides]MBC5646441.1 metallophosphoesterase family protein [Parabacteroides segnis]MCM0716532.1 metallophosphoesterase family protein [Parabacteroides sp. TA-V-105]
MNKISLLFILSVLITFSAYAQDDIKITHAPYLQNLGENEVTIVWTANKPSIGWVELAPDDGTHYYQTERPKFFNAKNGIKLTSTVHSVHLTGLKPGTRYRYRVYSQEVLSHVGWRVIYGNVAATSVYGKQPLTFLTSDHSRQSVNFAMVNDIHGKSDLLEKLISHCDLKKTDMFLFNGDMVSIFNNEKEIFEGFMDKATELFASEIPMYYTRGNHETRGSFAIAFQDYFSPKQEHIYYMFRQGPVCFVILDSGEDKPDSDLEYAGITVYDQYRTEQAEWLKKVLESKEYKEAPFKVVVCHMPPFGGWHGEQEVAEKFIPLLNNAGVDIMLCGHLHRYMRNEPKDGVRFPVIVNSNNTVLKAEAGAKELNIRILDMEGKEVDKLTITK